MKNLSKENIKKFIGYKKPNEEYVLSFFVLNISACVITIALSYNYLKCFLTLIPFILLSFIIFLFYKRIKKTEAKIINLFMGLEGIVLPIIFLCGSLNIVELTVYKKINLLILGITLNLAIIGLVIWMSMNLVRTKNYPAYKPVSLSIISLASLLGIYFSRKSTSVNGIIVCYIVFSCVACFAFICIIRYHYANVLEKMSEESYEGE